MALNSGKILMRRGQEVNFDPNKMTPGEWAVSLDSKYVRMCFSPGVCVRMATYDAFEADMVQIQRILAECQTIEEAVERIYGELKNVVVDVEKVEESARNAMQSEQNALNSANSASQSANTAVNKANEASESANTASAKAEQATEGARIATEKANEASESAENVRNISDASKSYAVGGTGAREDEDTDNAKYYNQQASDNADRAEAAAERASAVADIGVATTEKAGLVKPDGTTITVDEDGTIHSVGGGGGTSGTMNYDNLENKPSINGIELSGNNDLSSLGIQPAGNYLTEETDPTVPQWAKSENKPTYTASEVGADVEGSASLALSYAKSYTDSKIADLIGGAPSTLDTLKEISDALSESEEAVEAINQAIGNKLNTTGDSKDNTVTFSQAGTRTNITSTEKHSTLFGKIAKWFADLKTIAFTGSYDDLSDKPTIPTVNNATLTIQKNGVNVQTFTANSSSDKTANITVPTKTSELENDRGFISSANVLDTMEEIEANTSSGRFAGALAVKQLNNKLGGLRFGKDGDGNYGYYGADGSLIPFKNRKSLSWLKNVPDDDGYFLVYIQGAGASYYLIDTNGYSNLHVEHYANNKANNIRIYDNFDQTNQIGTISIDGGTFDVSNRNDVIYLRFWGNSYAVYKIYVT